MKYFYKFGYYVFFLLGFVLQLIIVALSFIMEGINNVKDWFNTHEIMSK